MPGALDGFKVTYHAVDASGQPVPWFGSRQEFVAVAEVGNGLSQFDAIVAILNSNGKGVPAGATLIIDQTVCTISGWTF
jgi:hypothetical protein